MQGHGLPLLQELRPLSESLFEPLVARGQEASFSIVPPVQALRGLPCPGLLCCLSRQAHRGAP